MLRFVKLVLYCGEASTDHTHCFLFVAPQIPQACALVICSRVRTHERGPASPRAFHAWNDPIPSSSVRRFAAVLYLLVVRRIGGSAFRCLRTVGDRAVERELPNLLRERADGVFEASNDALFSERHAVRADSRVELAAELLVLDLLVAASRTTQSPRQSVCAVSQDAHTPHPFVSQMHACVAPRVCSCTPALSSAPPPSRSCVLRGA